MLGSRPRHTPYLSPLSSPSTHLLHPPPPPTPLLPAQTRLTPHIPHDRHLNIPPPLPLPIPPRLPHQTHHRLLFRPPLFHSHVGQVGGAVAFGVVREGDADAVLAERPVEGVRGRFEVVEEGDAGGEGGEFGGGDGREAGVVEGAGEGSGLVDDFWWGGVGACVGGYVRC